MKVPNLFFNDYSRLRALWRFLVFIGALLLGILPLLLIDNSYIQFFGAVLILIFGLYLNSKCLDKYDFSQYGLVFNIETFALLIIGLLIGFFSVVMIFLIGISTDILIIEKVRSAINFGALLPFALKMLLVGILEETFFRGYLFTTIYHGLKLNNLPGSRALLIALTLSSVIFGFAHISTSNVSILALLLLSVNGLIWCIPFIVTKNLGLSIGLHTAWNFSQTLIGFTMSGNKAINSIYRIHNNGPELLTGGGYGPEGGILGLIGFMVMLLLSLTYLMLRGKHNKVVQKG